MKKLGILLSGRGSNFLAIARAIQSGAVPAEIALVASNNPEAAGIAAARDLELPTWSRQSKGVPRTEFDASLAAALEAHGVEFICLAGYMRLLSPAFIQRFSRRIINIHPSLLPAFPGLDAQHQAWEHGVKIAGCTVHFVDEQLDNGPIILQAAVPVKPSDTPEVLAARILEQEHLLYPEALRLLLTQSWEIEGRRWIPRGIMG